MNPRHAFRRKPTGKDANERSIAVLVVSLSLLVSVLIFLSLGLLL
jgi:hypothetical protein